LDGWGHCPSSVRPMRFTYLVLAIAGTFGGGLALVLLTGG